MTKLIHLRVTVAADDAVTTEDATRWLHDLLAALPAAPAGNEPPHRVHWSTVDVARLVTLAPSSTRTATSRKRPGAPAQTEVTP